MVDKRRETFDVFAVPRNFGEDGVTFNGISRRNLIEGAAFAVLSGYPIAFHLPFALSVRIILLCFVSLPLFFFGMIGVGGESVIQFVVTFAKWLLRRRTLRYYIDVGEEEPERPRGFDRIKGLFRKRDKDEIVYKKPKRARNKGQDERASRQIKHQAQTWLPVEDIRGGMIVTRDGRYVKIVEITPINFLLRSAEEQRDIILSFAELLRIAPVKLQFKSIAIRADVAEFVERTRREIDAEQNKKCREMGRDYIDHIQAIATNNAISRRFFAIFEYENPYPANRPTEPDILFHLESAVRNFRTYLSRCGNQIVDYETVEEENEALLHILHTILAHYNTGGVTLEEKQNRAFRLRLQGDNMAEMATADYLCPDRVDFTHGKYVVVDGVYHAYLYIPAGGFKTLVGAAWLSPLINAGEAIDVDLFLHKQPADRMQQQVSRNLRLNKAKLGEISSTSADFNRMGDIMESGYYLQRGLNDGLEFFYMNVLVTIKAYTKKDLDNRVNEVVKMMVAKQVALRNAAYLQEPAMLSTLPLAKLDPKLYKLGRRNVLTNTAASTFMFTAFEICDSKGVLLGTNEHNNSLVVLDLFNSRKYKNANMTIMGTSGAGKSFTLQVLATRLRRKHVQTFIIAPLKGHEFKRCCEEIGGQFIRISTGSPHCINAMEIRKMDNSANELLDGEAEEQSYLSMKIDSLLIFFSILMPEMSNVEEQLLDEALVKTYADFGITNDNQSLIDPDHPDRFRPMPILEDLYNNLRTNPKSERLAIILNRFVGGSARAFNQQTNVSLDNPYTVIDLSYLKGKMLAAGMFLALDFVWVKARENRMVNKAIIIDEVWQLIGGASSRLAAEYVVEIAKVIRAYAGAGIFATQDVGDFFALDDGKYGKAVINNSKLKIVLNMEPHEAERAGEILNLTSTEVHKIKHFERGHGILSANGNNIAVKFRASDKEKDLITTDPEELRRLAERKRSEQPTSQQEQSEGVGRRMLLTPDEVLRLPQEELLIIQRGKSVLQANKFDYTRHPESRLFRPDPVEGYTLRRRENDRRRQSNTDHKQKDASGMGERPSVIPAREVADHVGRTLMQHPGQKSKTLLSADGKRIQKNEKEVSSSEVGQQHSKTASKRARPDL